MHCAQPCVQIIWSEVLSLMPGDRREPVVQIELRKPRPIAQPFELLAVQLVGEIDYAFSSVVELQPNLVVTEIPRIHHMTRHMLVLGHLPGPPGWLFGRLSLTPPMTHFASCYPASKCNQFLSGSRRLALLYLTIPLSRQNHVSGSPHSL